MAWARPPIRTPLWEAVDKRAKLHKIVRGKVQELPREQMCRRAPLKSPSMHCSAAACCSLVHAVRNQSCRLPMASTKVVQGMGPLAAAQMPTLPTSTPALLEPRSTCSPTNQTGRWHCCRSSWPGQAPLQGWPGHDLALVTAAPDADGTVLRPDRPRTKRSAARTKPRAAPPVAPRGAPPGEALDLAARCSWLS